MAMHREKVYVAIDLKSFYASVECVERGLDPLSTHLVVADLSRTEKTICLAVSPALKAYGVGGRARLFEVVQRVAQVNGERQRAAGRALAGKTASATELARHPDWALDYIVAPPHMRRYIEYSERVHSVYLRYVAEEDIHVYSVDEVFIDLTPYLAHSGLEPREMAIRMIRDVLATTGVTATAGIGTNLFLAKVAMDIVAKHVEADQDGVRIAQLDEQSYRRTLWGHLPITDFWRVGRGTAARLARYGLYTMGDVARQSVRNEDLLYRIFGVSAELLIDHAWGWEPCTIEAIHAYRPATKSMSNGQVLHHPYTADRARVVVREMAENTAERLLSHRMVTGQIVLSLGYDRESLARPEVARAYAGSVATDRYGRQVPRPVRGTERLETPTSAASVISAAVERIYDRIVDRSLLIRRINIAADCTPERTSQAQGQGPVQLDLFTDYERVRREREATARRLAKERRIQETMIEIRGKYGRNALLKGLNFDEGATARDRNRQIGGHHE